VDFGATLLEAPADQRAVLIHDALQQVDKWEAWNLCSSDYIDTWRTWLALPVEELAHVMCSGAQGWGVAMRQNSPFLLDS
jgi:hypothetical protein